MKRVDKPRPFKEIGRRIELIRQAAGYSTKAKFADTIGLSPQGYNGYASGSERMGVDAAQRVCERFGTSLDYIYRGIESGVESRPHLEIGLRLELIRQASSYSQKSKFAKAIGLTPQGYSGCLSGTERMGINTALLVCERFGTSLDFIYRGIESGVDEGVIEKIREIRAIEESEDKKDE